MAQSIDRRAVFITFEGPDGSGKSSQLVHLAERLTKTGVTVTVTREPGGTQLGERVRAVLLRDSSAAHDPLSDALLFNAARHQLVKDVIAPALTGRGVVLCDRFADSTLAYQGYGAGVPLHTLKELAEIATEGLRPTRTVLLDLPVEDGLARRRSGPTAELTRFETSAAHDRAFHERVRAGYLELAAAETARWRVVDASWPPDEVAESVWDAVRDLFG